MPTRARLLPSIAALLFTCLPACESGPAASPGAAQATSAAGLPDHDSPLAHKLVASGALLLDVRSPGEFAGKHIDGAVNIPVNEIEGRMAEIEKLTGGDKKKPIVVYCQAGGRSAASKKMLVKAGYEQVTNLGGISNW